MDYTPVINLKSNYFKLFPLLLIKNLTASNQHIEIIAKIKCHHEFVLLHYVYIVSFFHKIVFD